MTTSPPITSVANSKAVVLFCDAAYLPPALFVASQILTQPSFTDDILIFLFGGHALPIVPSDPRLKIIDAELPASDMPASSNARRSSVVFARLYMSGLIPDTYRRILYLDADVWVSQKPVSTLLNMDMRGYPVAAVHDSAEIMRGTHPEWLTYKSNIGLTPDMPYFNSGVLVIDFQQFQKERIGERSLQYINEGRYLGRLEDQTALNAILRGNWLPLSPMWNWMFASRNHLTETFNPGIVHFIGPHKPWRGKKLRFAVRYRQDMTVFFSSIGLEGYIKPLARGAMVQADVAERLQALKSKFISNRRDEAIKAFMTRRDFAGERDP